MPTPLRTYLEVPAVEGGVQLAVDHQHGPGLGREANGRRLFPLLGRHDLRAPVLMNLENAVGHQMEVPAALAPVDRPQLLAVFDQQADRLAAFIEHPGVHRKRDLVGSLPKRRLKRGKAAIRTARSGRSDLDLPARRLANGKAAPFEQARGASGPGLFACGVRLGAGRQEQQKGRKKPHPATLKVQAAVSMPMSLSLR